MSDSIFGWSLPPGCSMRDIDEAFGDPPLLDEIFEANNLNDDERKIWAQIYDLDDELFNLIIRAMEWSHKPGYDACNADKSEAEFYEEIAREYQQNKDLINK